MPNVKNQSKRSEPVAKSRKTLPKKVPVRRLTVSSQSVTSQSSANGLKNIPFLRLTGVWLDEAGFRIRIDSKVDIIVDNNLLIIKPTIM